MKRFVNELMRCKRYKHAVGLLILDIDHFKLVNDTFGHSVGDKVLRSLGEHLYQTMRMSDLVARYGGEEFVILLPESTPETVQNAAERVRESIAAASGEWVEELAGITVSVGGVHAAWNAHRFGAKQIFDTADKCLYEAKNAGRDCCRCTVL